MNQPQGNAAPVAGSSFTLRQGKRYRATIVLHGLEQLASDASLTEKFVGYGFTNVQVVGSGGTRTGEGTWSRPDVPGQIDSHIVSVTQIA